MAVTNFEVYPTADLHLLITPVKTVYQIKPRGMTSATYDSVGMGLHATEGQSLTGNGNPANVTTEYIDFNAAVATVDKGKFTAVAAGDTVGYIKVTDKTNADPAKHIVSELPVRVRVHDHIDDFWIGNNSITIHEGESNYVITVYARFSDGKIGDITYHPYLTFTSADAAKLSVDAEGRLSGKQKNNTVKITVTHNGTSKDIDVNVIEPLSTERPFLVPVLGNGSFTERKNMLILSEGFKDTPEDKALFTELVDTLVKDELFGTNAYSPYHHLKDSFLVWKAFLPSTEDGLTIRNPVKADGTPIETKPDYETNMEGFTQVKNTFFGLAMGNRFSEKSSYPYDITNAANGTTTPDLWWIPQSAARTISQDNRRSAKTHFLNEFMYKVIRSLRLKENATTDPNKDVWQIWSREKNFRDGAAICFIAKDGFRCGTNTVSALKFPGKDSFPYGALFLTMGKDQDKHKIQTRAGINKIIDHPSGIEVVIPALLNMSNLKTDVFDLASTIAHELAHSMRMGDEYESSKEENQLALPAPQPGQKTKIEENFINLLDYYKIKDAVDAYPKINNAKLIWNWHLMDKASVLKSDSVKGSGASNNTITITIKNGDGINFPLHSQVFLRHPLMNTDADNLQKNIIGPLEVIEAKVVTGNDTLKLKQTSAIADSFPKGSVVFIPLKNKAGEIQTLIHPKVNAYLIAKREPFNHQNKMAPAYYNTLHIENETENPEAIAGFNLPPRAFELVGNYEGGGTYNTKVYRPTGTGMMRSSKHTEIVQAKDPFDPTRTIKAPTTKNGQFSIVNKYIIINHIDPSQLPKLNNELPDKSERNL